MAEVTNDNVVPISGITAQMLTAQSKSQSTDVDLIDFNPSKCCNDNGKNAMILICGKCKCKILKQGFGSMVEKEIFLPNMTGKYEIGTEPVGETIQNFWLVVDMFHFENVGFSKSIEDIKYLICADCEVGPIGWHKTTNSSEFYIACTRVKYGTK